MFRDNEASRVGEVLAQEAAGDRAGAIAAAVELWLSPVERADGPDGAAIETWRAITALGATAEAVTAGLAAIRGKQLVRSHAFIELVERIDDPAVLIELATLALHCRWPVTPYLSTICFALIDGKHEDALWDFIQRHRDRLSVATPEWILIGVILTTSRVGKSADVSAWFLGFEKRADVPMWIIVAFVSSVLQRGTPLAGVAEVAGVALGSCVPDATAGTLLAAVLLRLVATKQQPEFFATFRAGRAVLVPCAIDAAHPLVQYVNAAKHARAVSDADLAFSMAELESVAITPSLIMLAARTQAPRPPNWRLVALIREPHAVVASASRLFPLLAELDTVTRGDPKAIEINRQIQKSRPSDLPVILPLWHRIEKQKIRWLTRLKLAYF